VGEDASTERLTLRWRRRGQRWTLGQHISKGFVYTPPMEALLEKEGAVEKWNDDRLDELSRRMDSGFKEMREGFARVDARFAQMDAKFIQVDDRFAQMDAKFIQVDARFAQMDAKFDAKFDRVDAKLDKLFIAVLTVGGGFAATTVASLLGILFL
jgi:hypothetical protein